ncbi:MAG: tetratricopeptide repeat protein [Phycisphaeraceae bacterium]|nr:tetratricopeptide repeat protein [Phycisphaeraceae bacterium]
MAITTCRSPQNGSKPGKPQPHAAENVSDRPQGCSLFPGRPQNVFTRSLLFVALLASSLLSLPLYAENVEAQQQFIFAYRLLQRGEDKLAAEAFDDFLKSYPDDSRRSDARFYQAVLAQRAGDNEGAARLLAAATDPPPSLVPEHTVLQLRGQIAISRERYDEAVATLEKIKLDSLDAASKATTLYLTGLAYRGAGNLPGAAKALIAAAGVESPLKGRALLEAAQVQIEMDKVADAQATLAQAVANADKLTLPGALMMAGDLSLKSGQFPKAIEYFNAIVTGHQSTPQFGPAVLGLLWSRFSAKQFDELLKTADQFKLTVASGSPIQGNDLYTARYLVGSAQLELKQNDKAAETFQSLLAQGGESELRDKVTYKLALAQVELNKPADVVQTLTNFSSTFPKSPLVPDAEMLLATTQGASDPAAGAARLTSLVNQGPDKPDYARAVFQRARLYDNAGQTQAAIDDYKSYLGTAAGKADTAQAAVIGLRLANLWDKLGKLDQAESAAAGVLQTAGIAPLIEQEAMYLRAMSLVKLNKLDAALDQFNQLLTKHPQSRFLTEARYYRGLILVAKQKSDDAMADLQASADAKDFPSPMKANALRLMGQYQRQKTDDKSIAAAAVTLTALEKLVGTSALRPDELLWLGQWQTNQKQPKESLKYLALLIDSKSTAPPAIRAEALVLGGRNLRENGDIAGALDAFRRVIAMQQGFESHARLELARTLVTQNKLDEALTEYRSLINVERPTIIPASATYESAEIHRQKAIALKQNDEGPAAVAELEEAQKLYYRVGLLFAFPQLSPVPELAYINRAETLDDLGRKDEGDKALAELTEKFPDSSYASYAKAMIALHQGKAGDADFLLKKLREQQLDPRLSEKVTRRLKALSPP